MENSHAIRVTVFFGANCPHHGLSGWKDFVDFFATGLNLGGFEIRVQSNLLGFLFWQKVEVHVFLVKSPTKAAGLFVGITD